MAQYRVVVGIDYPPNKRAEAGDLVDDLPSSAIKWLLECGAIESPNAKPKKEEAPIEENKVDVITLSDGIDAKEEKAILETAEELKKEVE